MKSLFLPAIGWLTGTIPRSLGGTQALNEWRVWMSRLAVAYGLSFYKDDLTGFTYPRDVEPPEPDQLWPVRRYLPEFISKDHC